MEIIVNVKKESLIESARGKAFNANHKEEILLIIPEEKLFELQMVHHNTKSSIQVWIQLKNWVYSVINTENFNIIDAVKVIKDIINYPFSTESDFNMLILSSDAFMY